MEAAAGRDKVLREGECSRPVLDRSVRKRLGALCEKNTNSETAVISVPVLYGRTGCGTRAVRAAAGKLLAGGCRPRTFAPVLLLPPGTMESELRALSDEVREACLQEDMTVSGIHAEVTGTVRQPAVIGTASGKRMHPFPAHVTRECFETEEERLEILMTGYAAAEACRLIAAEKREELKARFSEAFLDLCLRAGVEDGTAGLYRTAGILWEEGACQMAYLSSGGLYAGLRELMERSGCGVEIETMAVPILQESIEIAEFYDFDPFAALSGGCFLAIVRDGDAVKKRLMEAGIPSAVIGKAHKTRKGKAGKLVHGEETRFLDLPPADAVIKVLKE